MQNTKQLQSKSNRSEPHERVKIILPIIRFFFKRNQAHRRGLMGRRSRHWNGVIVLILFTTIFVTIWNQLWTLSKIRILSGSLQLEELYDEPTFLLRRTQQPWNSDHHLRMNESLHTKTIPPQISISYMYYPSDMHSKLHSIVVQINPIFIILPTSDPNQNPFPTRYTSWLISNSR